MTLEIRAVSKFFGGFQALADVSLSVDEAGLVGLIGPNGAGKSTLFAVVSGFQTADHGEVVFRGRELRRSPPHQRVRLGLARTFQVPREFAHLSVRENMMVAAPDQTGENLFSLWFRTTAVAAQERELTRRVDRLLEFLDLARVADQRAAELSGGQKKLLELGRALMVEPAFVLLDEPFAGVNPVLIDEIAARIRDLHADGIGFFIVEHNLQALASLVDELFVMDRGRIIASGDPRSVLTDAAVREAYMGGIP